MNNPTIVLLYSHNSPKCNQFRSMIKDDFLHLFKPICVDNKNARDLLNRSTTLKIKSVPCIIEIFPDGNLASYEDIKAFEWMNNFISILDQKPLPKEQPHKPLQQVIQQPPNRLPKNIPIDDVFLEQREPQIAGLQNNNVRIAEKNPDITSVRGPKRSVYRGEVEDNQYMGLNSERDLYNGEIDRPMRGSGHNSMASTSLTDVDIEPQLSRQVPHNSGGNKVKMIEDLTPYDEDEVQEENMEFDDPSGMSVPRDSGNGGGGGMNEIRSNKAKEKSSNLKNLAASIERARKSEEEQAESFKQGANKKQRENIRNEPINL